MSTEATLTEQEKELHLAVAIGALESIRYAEHKVDPKSRRTRVISNIMEHCQKALAMYNVNDWPPERINQVWDVLSDTEQRLQKVLGAA